MTVNLDENIKFIYANRIQLEHVLFNLISNSIESMSNTRFKREINVEIFNHKEPEKILIKVQDQGAGISSANTNQVVNPYFTTRENGLGMGLPISKSIVKAHGGELWIDKTSDQGTTIAFTLLKFDDSETLVKPQQTYA